MDEVSIMTVVFGGNATTLSISCVAARCSLWREMEARTVEVRRDE